MHTFFVNWAVLDGIHEPVWKLAGADLRSYPFRSVIDKTLPLRGRVDRSHNYVKEIQVQHGIMGSKA